MADISYRAERFWLRGKRPGWRWTGFAYDDCGRVLMGDGPHRSKESALAGIRQAVSVKYGISAAA